MPNAWRWMGFLCLTQIHTHYTNEKTKEKCKTIQRIAGDAVIALLFYGQTLALNEPHANASSKKLKKKHERERDNQDISRAFTQCIFIQKCRRRDSTDRKTCDLLLNVFVLCFYLYSFFCFLFICFFCGPMQFLAKKID